MARSFPIQWFINPVIPCRGEVGAWISWLQTHCPKYLTIIEEVEKFEGCSIKDYGNSIFAIRYECDLELETIEQIRRLSFELTKSGVIFGAYFSLPFIQTIIGNRVCLIGNAEYFNVRFKMASLGVGYVELTTREAQKSGFFRSGPFC